MKGEIVSEKRWKGLKVSERETFGRVLHALAISRREGRSLSDAARRAGTTPATVERYAGSAVERRGRRVVVRRGDRLYRRLLVQTVDGQREIGVRGSHAASAVAGHWHALNLYLLHGDDRELRRFADKRVGGYRLQTDLDEIEAAHDREEVRFEDLYAEAA